MQKAHHFKVLPALCSTLYHPVGYSRSITPLATQASHAHILLQLVKKAAGVTMKASAGPLSPAQAAQKGLDTVSHAGTTLTGLSVLDLCKSLDMEYCGMVSWMLLSACLQP
jgi:hypothetical protein